MTPSARSKKELEKQGFIVAPVEQFVRMPGRPFSNRRDAFGFGDLLVVKPGWGTALIQVTAGSNNVWNRVNKILGVPEDPTDQDSIDTAAKIRKNAETWLRSGDRILVHGWQKRGPRGKRKIWTLTERELTIADFDKPSNPAS